MQFIVNVWKVKKDRNILIEFAQGGGGVTFYCDIPQFQCTFAR